MSTNGEAPPTARPEVTIRTVIIQESLETTAKRGTDGNYEISFIVFEGNEPILRTMRVGEKGRHQVLEVLAGGLHLP